MAINVDRVYRTVLRIVNKESRGTVTPDEFAKIGHQVQLELIDKAMYDYNNALIKRHNYMANEGYANIPDKIREKIDELSEEVTIAITGGEGTLPTSFLRVIDVSSSDRTVRYEEISKHEASLIKRSPLTSPSVDFPLFFRKGSGDTIEVLPNVSPIGSASVIVDYLKYPDVPRWGYFTNANTGAKEYDSNTYVANGLVIGGNNKTIFDANITNGIDGTYTVDATDGENTVSCEVTVLGNIVTSLSFLDSGNNISAGTVFTVGRTTSLPANGDIPVTSLVGDDLTFTIAATDLYSGSTAGSTNFAIHQSEEIDLVKGILAYMGITLGNAEITQAATQIMQANEVSKMQSQ